MILDCILPKKLRIKSIVCACEIAVIIERMNLKNGKVDCRMLIKQGQEEKRQVCFKEGKEQMNSFKKETFLDMVVTVAEEAFYDTSPQPAIRL